MRLARIQIKDKWVTYKPIVPCADTDELANESARLMLYHDRKETLIFVAGKEDFCSGWVLGTWAVYE